MNQENSLEELLDYVTDLAFKLSRIDMGGSRFSKQGFGDLIWGYAEGLVQKRIMDEAFGRCSLLKFMEFDYDKTFQKVLDDIEILESLYKQI